MHQAFQINPGPIYRKENPERNPAYLRWIRSFPCIVCGTGRYVEAAHFGPHGIGQKASDLNALPLCSRHHRKDNRSYHQLGPARFALAFNVDTPQLIQMFNRMWKLRQERVA